MLARSHVCVTNRSSLVHPSPSQPHHHPHPAITPLPCTRSLSVCLETRVKGRLAGCLVTEKSCSTEQKSKKKKKRKERGEKPLNSRDCALGMLMRQGPFFPCLVPPSEPTNSSVDVWAICTQHARRETESKLL